MANLSSLRAHMHIGQQHWDTHGNTLARGTVPRMPVLHVTRIGQALVRAEIGWDDGTASQGWGRDALPAIAEAVERGACARLPASAFRARAADLQPWLPPDQVVRYTTAQHRTRGFPFRRFDARQERWWVPGTWTDSGAPVAVPADLVCLPRAFTPTHRKELLTHATTSGCATDPSAATATERALYELAERDAFMRHWWAQAPGCAIARASLPLPLPEASASGVQCLDRGAQPTWLAWAQDEERHFTCIGSASGRDPEAALAQALHELQTALLAQGAHPAVAEPDVRTPADHAALYATRGHFRRADAVLFARREIPFAEAAARFARAPRLPRAAIVSLDFDEATDVFGLHIVRAVAPGLVPIAFGHGLQPLGRAKRLAPGAEAVHPFC